MSWPVPPTNDCVKAPLLALANSIVSTPDEPDALIAAAAFKSYVLAVK